MKKRILSERGVYERIESEEDILGEIRQMLELNGARVFRAIERVPKCYRCGLWLGSSEQGTPDLSGYFRFDGTIFPFWFEVKRKKGKRRESQINRILQLRNDGACAAIVESWEETIAEIERRGFTVTVR
jgi:hypothetical protein